MIRAVKAVWLGQPANVRINGVKNDGDDPARTKGRISLSLDASIRQHKRGM